MFFWDNDEDVLKIISPNELSTQYLDRGVEIGSLN